MKPGKTKGVRGRPRAFERQQAVAAAMALFWEKGYEETSITDLTLALGIAPPSLYAAFGSKEGLYREAIDSYVASHGARLLGELQQADSAKAGIEKMLQAAAQAFTDQQHPPGCLVASGMLRGAARSQSAASYTASFRKLAQAAIQDRLEAAKQAKEVAGATNVQALAAFYAALIQGLSVQAIDGATQECLLETIDLAMTVWPLPGELTTASRSSPMKKSSTPILPPHGAD